MQTTIILEGKSATYHDGEWSGDETLVSKAYGAMDPAWEYEESDDPDFDIAARTAALLNADVLVNKQALIDRFGEDIVNKSITGDFEHPLEMLPVTKSDESKYTFSVVYKATPASAATAKELVLDAHREYITDQELFAAVTKYVESGDRRIFLQHGHTDKYNTAPAGHWTQIVQWPHEVTTKVSHPGGVEKSVTVPANSVFMGVKWEDWAWPLVKAGRIRGLSLGGYAQRIPTTLE